MAIYSSCLKPAATHDLVRIGGQFDGGYVLPERILLATQGLLSLGLSDNWSFEEDFAAAAGVPVVCFDHTVDRRFLARRIAANLSKGVFCADGLRLRRATRVFGYRRFFRGANRHVRRPVGYATSGGVSLSEAMGIAGFDNRVFLKVDIEGWEYRILDEIAVHADRFSGLAFEFHDIDLHADRIARFVSAVAPNLFVVHFHPNTYSQIGPNHMALHVEVTFMAHSLLGANERPEPKALPLDGLDQVNIPGDRTAPIEFDGVAG